MGAKISKLNSLVTPESFKAQDVLHELNYVDPDEPVCRICYADASYQQLIKPCQCRGSVRFVHRRCLELWLAFTSGVSCELCRHPYFTVRTPKSFWQWIRQDQDALCNMVADVVGVLFLAPLCLVSPWLDARYWLRYCTAAALDFASRSVLTAFLLHTSCNFVCCSVARFRHRYAKWGAVNFNVRVLDRQLPLDNKGTNGLTSRNPSATSSQQLMR